MKPDGRHGSQVAAAPTAEKRKAVEIVASDVQFLGSKNGSGTAAATAPDDEEVF